MCQAVSAPVITTTGHVGHIHRSAQVGCWRLSDFVEVELVDEASWTVGSLLRSQLVLVQEHVTLDSSISEVHLL